MSILKKSLLAVAVSGLMVGSALAQDNLVIANKTANQYSTVFIAGKCSNTIPGIKGVTGPGDSNSIPWTMVQLLCGSSATCKVPTYLTTNSSGTCDDAHKVGDVVVDAKANPGTLQFTATGPIKATAAISGHNVTITG